MAAADQDKIFRIVIDYQTGYSNLQRINTAIKGVNDKIKELNKSQKELEKQGKLDDQTRASNAASLSRLRQEYGILSEQRKRAISTARSYAKELSAQANTINELRARVGRLSKEWAEADRSSPQFGRLTRELNTANRELAKAEKSVRVFSRGVGNYFSSIIKGAVSMAGATLSFNALARGVTNSVTIIRDFEQANANLATILGRSRSEITALTDSARQLGATTEWMASQVTKLQTELAKLGFAEQDILQMQASILQFATALQADLPRAAALTGAALRAFNLEADQTERVAAVMTLGANRSALSFSFLESAMSTIAPVAKSFGFTIEDTVSLLGTLANAGFDASSAATATRNILLNLADAGGDLAQELGGPVKTIPELVSALIKLRDSGIDLSETLELTDKRSVAAFNTFLRGAESLVGLRDQLDDTGGVLERIQKEQLDTTTGSLKLLRSAWEAFILSMSESAGFLRVAIDLLTKIVNNIGGITTTTLTYIAALKALNYAKTLYVALSKTAATTTYAETKAVALQVANLKSASAATQLLSAAKFLLTGNINAATKAFRLFTASIASNPFGLIATAIAGVVAYFTIFRKESNTVRDSVVAMQSELRKEQDLLQSTAKAAMNAGEGTKERTTAINILNDKYGQYLPALLSEKSTNEDIALAIQSVNTALEENIRLKYKKEAVDKANDALAQTEEKQLRKLLDLYGKTAPSEIQIFAAAYADLLDALKGDDVAAANKAQKEFVDRFGLNMQRALWSITNVRVGIRNLNKDLAFAEGLYQPVSGNDVPVAESSTTGDTQRKGAKERKKLAEDAAKERKKLAEEEAKRREQLAKDLAQAEVSAMQEGLDKRLAAQDLAYQQTLNKYEKDYSSFEGYETLKDLALQTHENKRQQILTSASEQELKAYISGLTDYEDILEAELALSQKAAAKQIEQTKKAAEERKKIVDAIGTRRDTGLTNADNSYQVQNDYIEATVTKEKELKKLRLANEIAVREAKTKTYTEELNSLRSLGMENSEQYQDALDKIGELGVELQNLGKGKEADGTDNRGWFARFFNISEEEMEELTKQLKEKAFAIAEQINGIIADAKKASIDRRLQMETQRITDETDSEKRALEDRRNRGLITEKAYQKELEKIDAAAEKRRVEAEKKAFKDKQAVDIKSALINTAISVTKTFAQWGWPTGIPFAALAAAEGAIQVAAIKAQKYKRGGTIKVGEASRIDGPSHSQGGIRIYAENNPNPIAEVEGGEVLAVVNRKSAAMKSLSDWNQAGGGKKFAAGGIAYPSFSVPAPAAIPSRQMFDATLSGEITALRGDISTAIEATNNRIDNLRVYVVESDMTSTQDTIRSIVGQQNF